MVIMIGVSVYAQQFDDGRSRPDSPSLFSYMKRKLDARAFHSLVFLLLFLLGIKVFYVCPIRHRNRASFSPFVSSCLHVQRPSVDYGGDSGDDQPEYFLAAVIMNRVFKEDLFGITSFECKQWIEYMLYAGVQHIYWYDSAVTPSELQEEQLLPYIKSGTLTYHRLHFDLFPGGNHVHDYHFQQYTSYAHFLIHYSNRTKWAVEMDIDEYPFSRADTGRCFLLRYVANMEVNSLNVSQLLLQSLIFGGNPQGERTEWIIERYERRKKHTEGKYSRAKPIFKARLSRGVTFRNPHMFTMLQGETAVADPETLRMNHYWGGRLMDWGPETAEVKGLVLDDSMRTLASEIKQLRDHQLNMGRRPWFPQSVTATSYGR